MRVNMQGKPGRYNAPYSGVPTFLRQDYCDDIETMDADIAILGVPTDEGSPFMAGSRFAPRSIREHSLRFSPEGYYNVLTDKNYLLWETANRRMVDVGDTDVLGTSIEQTFENITHDVEAILDDQVRKRLSFQCTYSLHRARNCDCLPRLARDSCNFRNIKPTRGVFA
mgnify:CR=1 FL=1